MFSFASDFGNGWQWLKILIFNISSMFLGEPGNDIGSSKWLEKKIFPEATFLEQSEAFI